MQLFRNSSDPIPAGLFRSDGITPIRTREPLSARLGRLIGQGRRPPLDPPRLSLVAPLGSSATETETETSDAAAEAVADSAGGSGAVARIV